MKKVIAILFVVAFVATAAFAADTAAASAAPASTAPAATNMSVAGTIVSFTADKTKKTLGTLVVVDAAKVKTSIEITSTTAITVAKKAGTVKNLAKNKKATVEYTVAGKIDTAVSVAL